MVSGMFWRNRKITVDDPVYSARHAIIMWQYLLKHGNQIERFFNGIDIPRKRLLNKYEWIDIRTSVKLMQNYRACIPGYDMTRAYEVAFEGFDSYAYGFTSGFFRLPSLQHVFRALPLIMTIPTRIELFRILESDAGSAVMEYTIYPGFESFIDSSFIYTWAGVFSAIPKIHGLAPARIEVVASFVDIFKRFEEDFGEFGHRIEEKKDGIYLDGRKAGRWVTITPDMRLDPLAHKYLNGEKCVLWEKDVAEIKKNGERITIAGKGELYNCSKTILRVTWDNISFLARLKNFCTFLKQYLPMQIQSRDALYRQTELLYEYSSLLKQKIEEKTIEVRNAQEKMFELEKRAIEHRITGGFAHEMRNALAGAQLETKTAMHYGSDRVPATDRLKASVAVLLKNISGIRLDPDDSENESIISDSVRELKQIEAIADFLSGFISGVSDDIERGLSITSQIHEYAKLHEVKAGRIPVNIFLVLDRLGREYGTDFSVQGIQYVVTCPKTLSFRSDETHLNSIFSNLILNARDALVDHAVAEPKISVDVEQKADGIDIRILDNGPGISPEIINDIFNPFFTTKPPEGKGLGLSFVKRLLALYNGNISVEATPGAGSEFRVTLPLSAPGGTEL